MYSYLPTYLSTYLSTYLPACLPACLPTYLSTYLPTYLAICLHTYLPTYLSTYLPTYLPTYLHTFPCILCSISWKSWPQGFKKDPHSTLWGTLGTKSTPKWPQRACHEAPCAPKGLPRTPKGAQRTPRMSTRPHRSSKMTPKMIPNDPQGHHKGIQQKSTG